MKLTLHHVNFATENVGRLDKFYRDVLYLEDETDDLPQREKHKGYPGDVSFLTDGRIQFHLAEKDLEVGFRTGHAVNPVDRGHIAYRTDDIDQFKKHLEAKSISYSDYGNIAVNGWQQIFFYDPDGNVIEVHQVHEQ
jgi:catechol 2,3-dioxygenase-like lactoylglutathione lyase family enzyme